MSNSQGSSYNYPGTETPQNMWAVRDRGELENLEATLTTIRAREGVPKGNFDLDHLKAIHKHLFQDVYEWAGELREEPVRKYSSNTRPFVRPDKVEKTLQGTFEKLHKDALLLGTDKEEFAGKLTGIVGDITRSYPFHEGNGRTLREFGSQLANNVGFEINWGAMDKAEWDRASKANHEGDPSAMKSLLMENTVTLAQAADPVNKINSPDRRVLASKDLRKLYPQFTQLADRLEHQELINNATKEQKSELYAFSKLPRNEALKRHPRLRDQYNKLDRGIMLSRAQFEQGSKGQKLFVLSVRDEIAKDIVSPPTPSKTATRTPAPAKETGYER